LDTKTKGAATQEQDSLLVKHWLGIVVILFIFSFSISVGPSADMWWHFGTGKLIVENRSVPHADPFSSTFAGKPWVAHEWLADVILYGAYALAGSQGLLLFAAAVVTLAFWLAYSTINGSPGIKFLALALGILAARPTFSVRPQIITFLFFAIFLLVLGRWQGCSEVKLLWLLPVLTLAWVNMHGAYIVGMALILLFMVGEATDALFQPALRPGLQKKLSQLLMALIACCAVVPVNPNGVRMYAYPFETLRSTAMQTNIAEWRPPDFHQPMFYPLVVLAILTIAAMVFGSRRPRPSEILLFVLFGYAALRSMRNLPFFVLVAFPLLGTLAVLPNWVRLTIPEGSSKILKIVTVLLVAALATQVVTSQFTTEILLEQARFPVRAAAFLDKNNLPGPIFNSYNYGGYLIWRLYPRYRVFIDGRADLYGDDFLNEFVEVYEVHVDPRPTLEQAGIRTVIVEADSNMARFLNAQKDWSLVYQDRVAVIFTR
jgi:hypothetical protein